MHWRNMYRKQVLQKNIQIKSLKKHGADFPPYGPQVLSCIQVFGYASVIKVQPILTLTLKENSEFYHMSKLIFDIIKKKIVTVFSASNICRNISYKKIGQRNNLDADWRRQGLLYFNSYCPSLLNLLFKIFVIIPCLSSFKNAPVHPSIFPANAVLHCFPHVSLKVP